VDSGPGPGQWAVGRGRRVAVMVGCGHRGRTSPWGRRGHGRVSSASTPGLRRRRML